MDGEADCAVPEYVPLIWTHPLPIWELDQCGSRIGAGGPTGDDEWSLILLVQHIWAHPRILHEWPMSVCDINIDRSLLLRTVLIVALVVASVLCCVVTDCQAAAVMLLCSSTARVHHLNLISGQSWEYPHQLPAAPAVEQQYLVCVQEQLSRFHIQNRRAISSLSGQNRIQST